MYSVLSLYNFTVHIHESEHQCLENMSHLQTTRDWANKTYMMFCVDLLYLLRRALFHAGPFSFTSITSACRDYLFRRYPRFFMLGYLGRSHGILRSFHCIFCRHSSWTMDIDMMNKFGGRLCIRSCKALNLKERFHIHNDKEGHYYQRPPKTSFNLNHCRLRKVRCQFTGCLCSFCLDSKHAVFLPSVYTDLRVQSLGISTIFRPRTVTPHPHNSLLSLNVLPR